MAAAGPPLPATASSSRDGADRPGRSALASGMGSEDYASRASPAWGRWSSRPSPFLPTPGETLLLLAYPALLVFGALFSLLSPQTRTAAAAAGDAASSYAHDSSTAAPSYFARKDNLLNVLFVKRGWGWITAAFFAFALTHPAFSAGAAEGSKNDGVGNRKGGVAGAPPVRDGEEKKQAPGTAENKASQGRGVLLAKATLRWAAVTAWWILVTQWCFGPPVIDRGFRWSGGKCEQAALREEALGQQRQGRHDRLAGGAERLEDMALVATAAACRTAGGQWHGGHDISGHVFLLVLGSFFLLQEVGWVVVRWARATLATAHLPVSEERFVVMPDGAVKGAGVDAAPASSVGAARPGPEGEGEELLGIGGKLALVVVGLSGWMLLMTAIYFHTWLEKLTGLLVALAGLYAVYILPRWVPAVRRVVGLPGI